MRLSIASGVATGAVALALYPLFQGGAWFWSSLGAILVVTGVGMLAGHYTLPGWLAPPVQVLAVLLYLTAVFAGDEAWARVFPTWDSLDRLDELLTTGFADIQRFAAPVPDNAGIVLLTCGGVGLIAVLVDLLAARLRRAALTGLPLLALFTVPAAVIVEPISWPAFIIGALGYLGILVADGRERVGQWGRAVLVRRTSSFTATRPNPADTGPLRLSGRRIGFTAIALAVLLPALLPTLEPDPLFNFGVGNGRGGGGNSISIPNPMVNLRGQLSLPENSTVLTYQASDSTPRYLRMYSLDVFDGEQWTMSEPRGRPEDRTSEAPMPPPPGQGANVPVTPATVTVTVSPQVRRLSFLPLPYPVSKVTVAGDWRPDRDTLMVFSTRNTAGGLTYQALTAEPEATADRLKAAPSPATAIRDRYLTLPENLPEEIRQLALRETKQDAGPYEQAIQLQEFFTKTGGFTYSLATQGHDGPALTDFLIRNRTGYCEQFAASMAVLARVLGIPSRVAIGYTGGSVTSEGWQVRTHDSHAWPELYFEGVGWLRFEPTPAGGAGQGSATVPSYTRPEVAPATPDEPSAAPSSAPDDSDSPTGAADDRRREQLDRDSGGALIPVDEGMPPAAKIGIGVAIALLVALIPALIRWQLRARRGRSYSRPVRGPGGEGSAVPDPTAVAPAAVREIRWEPAVTAAWAELDDALCDYGMSRQVSESPRALARRLAEQYVFEPEAATALARIAAAVERMLYARTAGEIGTLREDMRTVRRALAATVTRGRRIRAVLLPPSTLLRARAMGGRVLDGFDRLENIRLRRPVRKGA
ncbi:transglutaminaseTgpA domain-containing protein [Streptosporangium sp. NPDC000509]|uniref:transglutaminase family protein n=1 Tax=Streptosporangium sp. NPDC000509 TaxID=3366186 RepID=UPI003699A3BD